MGASPHMAERIRVMTPDYRFVHYLTMFAVLILYLTGSFARGSVGSSLHESLGLAWGGTLLVYGVGLALTHRVRIFDALLKPLALQVREGGALILHYVAGVPLPDSVRKSLSRYNVLATYASVLLIVGLIPLSAGGVSLVFLRPGSQLFFVMLRLHLLGVAFIGIFFLMHFFAVLTSENRTLVRAVLTDGKVPVDWAEEHNLSVQRLGPPHRSAAVDEIDG